MGSLDIVATNVTKSFGVQQALAGVSVSIPFGQHVAVMGPSGSGKTTLLQALAGIIPIDDGAVRCGAANLTAMSDAERSVVRLHQFGFVFQDGQLIDELTIWENVALPLMLVGMRKNEAHRVAYQWLTRLGIDECAAKLPAQVSGGQRQRAAIARAVAHHPSVIFADEPTAALDQATGHEMMQMLTTAASMEGTTLIVVTHDVNVANWCERVLEIRDGRIHLDRQLAGQGLTQQGLTQ